MQRRGRLQGKTGRSGGRANCGQAVMYEIRINYINIEYIKAIYILHIYYMYIDRIYI